MHFILRILILLRSCIKHREEGKKMITYVFPGQGSQSKGMGKLLFDEFTELTTEADQVLGYSIKELCLEDPNLNLSQTQYTQPALYVINALSYLKRINETGKKPDFVAGHSLGEYAALFAAGAFDFKTGLTLVKKRGEMMSRVTGGGMAAIIGLNEEQLEVVLKQHDLQSIDVANFNSPFQIVISGPKTDIDKAKLIFEGTTDVKLVTVLKTSGAFHSRYMEEAKKEFEGFIGNINFQELTIPVISNVHARPYQQSHIKQNLIDQITHSVKWTESIRYLMAFGEMEFEELGTGKVLNGLIQRIKREAEPLVVPSDEIAQILNKETPQISKTAQIAPNSTTTNQPEGLKNTQKPQKVEPDSSKGQLASEMVKNTQKGAKKLAPSIETAPKIHESEIEKTRKDELPQGQIVLNISASDLGSKEFKKDYNLKYAYLTGGMYRGIASKEIIVKMGKAGMMGFFGSGGLQLSQIEATIQYIQKELTSGEAYGMNLLYNMNNPEVEEKTVELYLKYGVKNIEAAAFLSITPALVKYRASGLTRDKSGKVIISNKIIAKISRPEVAEAFLSPAPEWIVAKLLAEHTITTEAAELLKEIPMADDICAEADSGGHTDGAVAYALMPAIIKLRDEMMEKYQYYHKVRVGAAGGIGTPRAAAAAFMLGADFIVTGSINQCTVEAATSDQVKDLLQQINVQDTEYAPAGDMFELGAKVQVLKKGVFFPARANKLYDLYRMFNSLNEIDAKTKTQIQEKYFKCSFEKVYDDVKAYYTASELERAERDSKYKMALIFKWYFGYSTQLALSGSQESIVDYQIHCGPALGAFNQWVKETNWENWRNRHADEMGKRIMDETASIFNEHFNQLVS